MEIAFELSLSMSSHKQDSIAQRQSTCLTHKESGVRTSVLSASEASKPHFFLLSFFCVLKATFVFSLHKNCLPFQPLPSPHLVLCSKAWSHTATTEGCMIVIGCVCCSCRKPFDRLQQSAAVTLCVCCHFEFTVREPSSPYSPSKTFRRISLHP